MNRITNNGSLPYGYSRWTDFYLRYDRSKMKPNEILEFEQSASNGYYEKLTYTQDYIKARCYDELISNDFTIDELHEIHMALHQYGHCDTKTKDKVSTLLKVRYDDEYAAKIRTHYEN